MEDGVIRLDKQEVVPPPPPPPLYDQRIVDELLELKRDIFSKIHRAEEREAFLIAYATMRSRQIDWEHMRSALAYPFPYDPAKSEDDT